MSLWGLNDYLDRSLPLGHLNVGYTPSVPRTCPPYGRSVGSRCGETWALTGAGLLNAHASWSCFPVDYGSNLEEDIQADTSGYLERILVCLLQVTQPGTQDSMA